MNIREITIGDVASVGEIYTQAFDHRPGAERFYRFEPYIQFCINEGYAFAVEEEGTLQAFIIGYEKPCMINGKVAYIELLAVRPDVQGHGYGKELINRFIEAAKSKGIKEVSVSTACYRDAYLIYRHLGFADTQNDMRILSKRI